MNRFQPVFGFAERNIFVSAQRETSCQRRAPGSFANLSAALLPDRAPSIKRGARIPSSVSMISGMVRAASTTALKPEREKMPLRVLVSRFG